MGSPPAIFFCFPGTPFSGVAPLQASLFAGTESSSHERILHYRDNLADVLELFGAYRRGALLPGVRKNSAVAARGRLFRFFRHAAKTRS